MTREMRQLLSDRGNELGAMQDIVSKADEAGRDLTPAEANEVDKHRLNIQKIDLKIDTLKQEELGDNLDEGREVTSGIQNHGKFKVFSKPSDLLKAFPNKEGLDLGKYIRGSITGVWNGAEKERDHFKSLSTGTGQVLIPEVLSTEILSLVMAKSLLYGSGVSMIPMTSNNMTIAKVTTGPTVGFKGEGQNAPGLTFDSTTGQYTTPDMAFTGIDLKSKTVYGLAKISNELLNSAANLSSVLAEAFSAALAGGIDQACIYGDGGTETNPAIKGIASDADINSVVSTGDYDVEGYSPFIKAVGKIRQANGEAKVMGINASTDMSLNLLTDAEGNPLQVPQVISGLDRRISNNLRSNLGTGTDESEALIYDPAAMVIGQQLSVKFQVSSVALDAWATGSTYFNIYSMLDFAILRPEWITRITGLK